MADAEAVALLLAALACGEQFAVRRATSNLAFAPDERARKEQEAIVAREREASDLVGARLREVGSEHLMERFRPFFDAFHDRCAPTDWVEAQAFHYIGDALVSEFGDRLAQVLDPVSAEVVAKALGGRDDQEAFSLEELQRAINDDPAVRDRISAYARRISGEALTQTSRALDSAAALRELLGGLQGEKELLLHLLEQHRIRLDRLGIDVLDADD
jgi:hypothetical protein